MALPPILNTGATGTEAIDVFLRDADNRHPSRARRWMPEPKNVFALSKMEQADDYELLNAQLSDAPQSERASRQVLKRRKKALDTALEVSGAEKKGGNDEVERASKRARLNSKLGKERRTLNSVMTSQQSLRRNLDVIREEITQYRDTIGVIKRQINQATVERKKIHAYFANMQNLLDEKTQRFSDEQAQCHRRLLEMRKDLQQQMQMKEDEKGEVLDAERVQAELRQRDRRIGDLQAEVVSLEKLLHMLEEVLKRMSTVADGPAAAAAPTDASSSSSSSSSSAGAAGVAGASVNNGAGVIPAGVSEAISRIHLDASTVDGILASVKRQESDWGTLEAASKQLQDSVKDATGKLTVMASAQEVLQEQLERERKLNTKLKLEMTQREQQNAEMAERYEKMEAELAALKRETAEQKLQIKQQVERIQVQQEIMEMADRQSAESENALVELLSEVRVVKGGQHHLQLAYNRVHKELSVLVAEKTELKEQVTSQEQEIASLHNSERYHIRNLIKVRTKNEELNAVNSLLQTRLHTAETTVQRLQVQNKQQEGDLIQLVKQVHEGQLKMAGDAWTRAKKLAPHIE